VERLAIRPMRIVQKNFPRVPAEVVFRLPIGDPQQISLRLSLFLVARQRFGGAQKDFLKQIVSHVLPPDNCLQVAANHVAVIVDPSG